MFGQLSSKIRRQNVTHITNINKIDNSSEKKTVVSSHVRNFQNIPILRQEYLLTTSNNLSQLMVQKDSL